MKLMVPQVLGLDIPLSPFMMTHILDPTHLSTSSAVPVSNVARTSTQGEGERAIYLGVELEMPSSLSPNRYCTETGSRRDVMQVCWAGYLSWWWRGGWSTIASWPRPVFS